MKIRTGFVSNSSSSSFIITNLTDEVKTLVDFVTENPQLINEYVEEYRSYVPLDNSKYTQKNLLKSARENNIKLLPGDNECVFGDESGVFVGEIFDYALRDGGNSASFRWNFHESLR